MPIQYQLRRGLAVDWTTNNSILASGEPGFETDTKKMKIGDGTTAWNSLGYTTGNSTFLAVSNTTGNVQITPAAVTVANATISTVIDNDFISVGNASINTVVNTTSFVIGTNFIANSTVLTFTPNTFNLGSSPTKAANGWAWLPNGIKVNWGIVVANTLTPNVVFSSAFGTACYGVVVTPAVSGIFIGANTPYVTYQASTSMLANCQIRSASTTTSANVYWIAYGV